MIIYKTQGTATFPTTSSVAKASNHVQPSIVVNQTTSLENIIHGKGYDQLKTFRHKEPTKKLNI